MEPIHLFEKAEFSKENFLPLPSRLRQEPILKSGETGRSLSP